MTDDLRGAKQRTSSGCYVILLSSSVVSGNAASRALKKIKFEKLGYFGVQDEPMSERHIPPEFAVTGFAISRTRSKL